MTKAQLRLLRSIYRAPKTLEDIASLYHLDFNSFYDSELYYTIFDSEMMNAITITKADNFKKSTVTIENSGIELVERTRRDALRWIIPVAISFLALIGAYRQELFAIAQAIMSLLK